MCFYSPDPCPTVVPGAAGTTPVLQEGQEGIKKMCAHFVYHHKMHVKGKVAINLVFGDMK